MTESREGGHPPGPALPYTVPGDIQGDNVSKTIQGVPESITRQQYVDLVRAVGFDTAAVMSLEFAVDGIHAIVKERKDGRDVIDLSRNGVVTNHVYIPVEG